MNDTIYIIIVVIINIDKVVYDLMKEKFRQPYKKYYHLIQISNA